MNVVSIKHWTGEAFGFLLAGAMFFSWGTGVQWLFLARPLWQLSLLIALIFLGIGVALHVGGLDRADIPGRGKRVLTVIAVSLATMPFMIAGFDFWLGHRADWGSYFTKSIIPCATVIFFVCYMIEPKRLGSGSENRPDA